MNPLPYVMHTWIDLQVYSEKSQMKGEWQSKGYVKQIQTFHIL